MIVVVVGADGGVAHAYAPAAVDVVVAYPASPTSYVDAQQLWLRSCRRTAARLIVDDDVVVVQLAPPPKRCCSLDLAMLAIV